MRQRGVDVSVVAAGEFAPGNGWLSETELREQVSATSARSRELEESSVNFS